MDSYSKDLHLRDKDYVPDIPNNELSSIEGGHEESQPRFSVDDPLEVQLRFDLGSLVDAQVLLDTHGPRESHWDFMRQEQGRFQTSSEENTALLGHVKQDDLKSFDHCEGWPQSTSQVDAQLFLDAQDDVSMITEAFERKDKSMAVSVEEDRSYPLHSYRHREEVAVWKGENKKLLEGKAQGVHNPCREGIADGAMEASHILVERPDKGAFESSTELSPPHPEVSQIPTDENNENHESEQSPSDVVIEPLLNSEQSTEGKAASLTVIEPECQVPPDVSEEEAKAKQELPLDSSNNNLAESAQQDALSIDDVEVSAQAEVVILTENVNGQAGQTMDAQDSSGLEEESKITALETKVDETVSVISESMEKNEVGHISSNIAEDMQETGTSPVIHSHVIFDHTSAHIERELPDVIPDTAENIAPVVHSHVIFGHTSPNVERESPDMIPDTGTPGGSCHESESTLQTSEVTEVVPDSDEKQSAAGLPCSEEDLIPQGFEGVAMSNISVLEKFKETSLINHSKVLNNENVDGMIIDATVRSCRDLEKIDEAERKAGEGLEAQGQITYKISVIEQADTDLADKKVIAAMECSTVVQEVTCLEPAASGFKHDTRYTTPAIEQADTDQAGETGVAAMELPTVEHQVPCFKHDTTYTTPVIEQADTDQAGETGVAAMELSTVEHQVPCLEPAASGLKQDATYKIPVIEQADTDQAGEKGVATMELSTVEQRLEPAASGLKHDTTYKIPVIEQADTDLAGEKGVAAMELLTVEQCLEPGASGLKQDTAYKIPVIEQADGFLAGEKGVAAIELSTVEQQVICLEPATHGLKQEITYKTAAIEQADTDLAGEKGVAEIELSTVEQQVMCLEPAASGPEQDAAASGLKQDAAASGLQNAPDVCTGAASHENTSLCNMEQEDSTHAIDSVTNLSVVTSETSLKHTTSGEHCARNFLEITQVSAVHDDSLKHSNYGIQSKDHAAQDTKNSGQKDEHRDAVANEFTVEHSSLGDESISKKIEAKGIDENSKQNELPADVSEVPIQEPSVKHHNGDQSASGCSTSSAKPHLLNGDKILTESTHPGGVLHVLLDVHKEGPPDDSVPKEALDQEHVQRIAIKEFAEVHTINTSDAVREDSGMAGEAAAGFSDPCVSVLLDVHKEGLSDDSLLKEALDQEHVQRIASNETVEDHSNNTRDAMIKDSGRAGESAAGFSDTYVSGLTDIAAASGSQEDEQLASKYATPTQDKASKRKSDPTTRNNRLKDSARASPVQVRSDQEQKNAGKEGLGKRKATPKSAAQKKGTEPLVEGFSSPKKSGSKSASGRKKGFSLPMIQDAGVSPAAKEGFQTPASISKSVSPVNVRQHGLPDLNGADIAVPMVLPPQPFSEPQQVQLRAQILVYGSLIQGAAPEEALMIAAFSIVSGAPVREVGRDLEASGRAVWEKQWQAAVERIHAKGSRDTLRDARGILVSNLPVTSAKVSEGDPKANSSPGVANSTIDARNAAGLHARVTDVPGTKVHPSRPRHGADPGFGISVSRSNQSASVIVPPVGPPGPSLSTALQAVSSPLSENLTQSSKPRVELQQITPPTYYPPPPLGPFLTGAPQWLSTASFPGSWVPPSQPAVYNSPSTLFAHAQTVVSSDQTPEIRRNTPVPSGTILPVNSIVPTLFTPIVGPLSATPTPAADPVQKRQPVSESRPRKRKKTQSETYISPADVVPNAPFTVGIGSQSTSVSDLPAGQAGLAISTTVNLPSLTTVESLAMVVANTQIPKTSQEASIVTTYANKVSAPTLANMLNAGTPTTAVERGLDKSLSLQNSTSQLAQAQTSAEEAASVAASAVRESESLWSQLKTQKNAGLTSDLEMQLLSSAAAVATAASVAKAAAAAARVAYEAAIQAKMISEGALGFGKQGNELESLRLLQDKTDTASQTWGMPESCNSIMAAAKMNSKKRLEAVSAAMVRAQNFESIIRAAELASNAVTQVGSVMAMGESVPFTLEMLMEAGPEGFQRLLSLGTPEDKDKTKAKGTGLPSPGRKGTPQQKSSIEKDNRPSRNIVSGNKEASIQREAQVDSWTTGSVMPARPENDVRINADLGVGLMTEFSKQKTPDQLAVYMQVPRQGLPPIRTESGLTMQQEVSIIDNQIIKGSPVEVMSDEKGLRGVWFSATVQNVDGGKVFVLYDDLLSDDGFSPLEEWIPLKGSSSKAPRVRLAHPNKNIGFEGTRKRRREAMGSHKWSVGDRVDAWIRDGWWEGEIKEIIEDGDSKAKVFFPGDGDTSLVKTSKLRPSLVWSNGHWVLWTDAKQGKNEPSKATNDPHEGETPIAKRQKTEKGQASNMPKEKSAESSIAEIAVTQKEGSLLDSAAVKLPTDFKGFAVGGVDKSKPQGSKVVFGVPRPTKKRKLIEVSKHYASARGARNTTTPTNNKHEAAMNAVLGFVAGSSEVSRLDGLKTKRRVFPSQKVKPHKEADSERAHSKVSAIRNKREDTKTVVRKNPSTREGLPSVPKNKEGKIISRKKLPSDKSEPVSQEQPEGFLSGDALPPTSSATILEVNKNTSSNIQEDCGKEPSHAAQKTGKPVEKQTVHAVKEAGRELSHAAQASDSKQTYSHSLKEREKQSSNPANGNRQISHSSKRKETVPGKDNQEPVHLSKESQKQSSVQDKEHESQPVQEGEKQLSSAEASREKRPTSPVNDSEKQRPHPSRETDKGKDVGKSGSETWEPRRTSRKIQPTSKLLEGLQTAPKLGKNSASHDKGSRNASKAHPQL